MHLQRNLRQSGRVDRLFSRVGAANGGPMESQYFNRGGLAMIGELDMREGGESAGPGTGTSDDIPAMLSDGAFVINSRTVRGLGAAMGGKGKQDTRDRGSKFLYSLQDKYGGKR
mgnify:CR=1 FL=1